MNFFQKIKSLFPSRNKKVTAPEVITIVTEGAALAVNSAKAFHLKLDYSDASIKTVDKVLKKVKVLYAKNDNELSNYGLVFGLYCIAVLERNHGKGFIERKYEADGPDEFPYLRNNQLIFPCLWCSHKLFYDDVPDVWSQFNEVIERESLENIKV